MVPIINETRSVSMFNSSVYVCFLDSLISELPQKVSVITVNETLFGYVFNVCFECAEGKPEVARCACRMNVKTIKHIADLTDRFNVRWVKCKQGGWVVGFEKVANPSLEGFKHPVRDTADFYSYFPGTEDKSVNDTQYQKTVDLGNNESLSIGIFPNGDYFHALTMTESKTNFKTFRGAANWLARRGYQPNGQRIETGE
tara:strand:+ start:173 stop:769 length:597 start_codon:yes stop_codon:yes gene_type:complete